MIILLCLLTVLSLGHSLEELPSRFEIETSINRTIDEVERMIREDPKLPKLTRTEIVDILYNITLHDSNSYSDKKTLQKARKEYQRALMVVLPYNPKDLNENLTELYTKAPLVEVVPDYSTTERIETILENGHKEEIVYSENFKEPTLFRSEEESYNKPSVMSEISTTEKISIVYENGKKEEIVYPVGSPFDNLVTSQHMDDSTPKKSSSERSQNQYKNHKETYTEVVGISNLESPPRKLDDNRQEAPQKYSFNLDNLEMPSSTEDPEITTDRRVTKRVLDSSPVSSKLEIVYSTSMTTKPPTKEPTGLPQKINSTSPPKPSQHVLTSDKWRYNAPPVTTQGPKKISSTYRNSPEKLQFTGESLGNSPDHSSSTTTTTTTIKPELSMNRQGDKSEKLNDVPFVERPSPVYVNPISSTAPTKNKYSSTYTATSGGFLTATTTVVPMREEVKELLASIGLHQDNKQNSLSTQSNLQIPNTNNAIYPQASALGGMGISSPSILSQNTFEHPNFDFRTGTDKLTPDMQLLFQRFGLQTSAKQPEVTTTTTTTTTKRPTEVIVDLNSYKKFKPLPTAKVENEEFRDFLAKFGLGTNDNRSEKSMKVKEQTTPSVIEAVPGDMKKILENIGLITRSQKSMDVTLGVSRSTTPKLHVFKPQEVPLNSEEQKMKINKLLDTVRKVQDGTANTQDVQKVANDLLESTKSLQNGPDPLSLEEILHLYNEEIRNEVKRQESGSAPEEESSSMTPATTESTSTTATSTSTTVPSTSSTTESVNLVGLAESFGGSTQAPDPVLPTQRRSGFYFLADWNTFLEVGEEGKDKVNLRFQPKAGDRTRFIPVTVP